MHGPPIADDVIDVDDYAITSEQAEWIATANRIELCDREDQLDYYWNMNGQVDERERAFMHAIEDRLDELDDDRD